MSDNQRFSGEEFDPNRELSEEQKAFLLEKSEQNPVENREEFVCIRTISLAELLIMVKSDKLLTTQNIYGQSLMGTNQDYLYTTINPQSRYLKSLDTLPPEVEDFDEESDTLKENAQIYGGKIAFRNYLAKISHLFVPNLIDELVAYERLADDYGDVPDTGLLIEVSTGYIYENLKDLNLGGESIGKSLSFLLSKLNPEFIEQKYEILLGLKNAVADRGSVQICFNSNLLKNIDQSISTGWFTQGLEQQENSENLSDNQHAHGPDDLLIPVSHLDNLNFKDIVFSITPLGEFEKDFFEKLRVS